MSESTTRSTASARQSLHGAMKKRSSISAKFKLNSAEKDGQEFSERVGEGGWQDSSLVENCQRCDCKFTVVNRKHHCRECGNVFCGKCSNYKLVVNGTMKRCCLDCYKTALSADTTNAPATRRSSVTARKGDAEGGNEVKISDVVSAGTTVDGHVVRTIDPKNDATVPLDLPPWVEALVYLSAESDGASETNGINNSPSSVKAIFPEGTLQDYVIQDIVQATQTLGVKNVHHTKDVRFMVRVRRRSANPLESEDLFGSPSVFLNCFVVGKYDVNLTSSEASAPLACNRVYLVMVTRWPFPALAYQLLNKISEALLWESSASSATTRDSTASNSSTVSLSGIGVTTGTVANMLMAAHSQILSNWSKPSSPGQLMYFPFLGEMMPYTVPSDIVVASGANLSTGVAYSNINLLVTLGPMGLLQHLFPLWELIVLGKDILVLGHTPTQVSEIVLALSSVLAPLNFTGDVRPYFTRRDGDFEAIKKCTLKKSQQVQQENEGSSGRQIKRVSMLIGTDDASLVTEFDHFCCCVFLAPPYYVNSINNSGSTGVGVSPLDQLHVVNFGEDIVREGMRKKSAASLIVINTPSSALAAEEEPSTTTGGVGGGGLLKKLGAKVKLGGGAAEESPSSAVSFSDCYKEWRAYIAEQKQGPILSTIVTRSPVGPDAMNAKVLHNVKALSKKDRVKLGDKMIRDHLRVLTTSYFKPVDGASLEVAQMRACALEKEQLNLESEKRSQLQQQEAKAQQIFDVEEVKDIFTQFPQWAPENVPTLIMWLGIAVAALLLYLVGVPFVALITVGFLLQDKIPWAQAPKPFERWLRKYVPLFVLYPRHFDREGKRIRRGDAVSAARARREAEAAEEEAEESASRVDRSKFNGVWKRVKTENYDSLMGAQGAGFVQRKLAASVPLTHTVTLNDDFSLFRLQEKGGPIDTDTTYEIGGPEVVTSVLGKSFIDKVFWAEDGTLRMRKVQSPEESYELNTIRSIEPNGQLKIVATFQSSKKPETVTATSYFQREGATPHTLPSGSKSDSIPSSTGGAPGKDPVPPQQTDEDVHPDFSGTWHRTKTVNFEAFVGVQGLGFMQRKLAASMPLTHVITMSLDRSQSGCPGSVRLQEHGGPLSTDNTCVLGAEFSDMQISNRKFRNRMFWGNAGELITHRIPEDNSYELVLTRKLSDSSSPEKEIVLTSLHRNLTTKVETVATSYFSYYGPSPSPKPAVKRSQVNSKVAPVDRVDDSAAAPVVNSSATAQEDPKKVADPSPRAEVSRASDGTSDDGNFEDWNSSNLHHIESLNALSQAYASPSNSRRDENANDSSDSEDDVGGGGAQGGAADNNEDIFSDVGDSEDTNFSGVWVREDSGANNVPHTHTITMDEDRSTVRIEETGYGVHSDISCSTDGKPDTKMTNGRPAKIRCYWQGNTLVITKSVLGDGFELIQKRDLERDPKSHRKFIRLITIRRNNMTGEETETMALFHFSDSSYSVVVPTASQAATPQASVSSLLRPVGGNSDSAADQEDVSRGLFNSSFGGDS